MQRYIMQFFEYKHLPGHLQIISKPICEMAHALNMTLPDGPEKWAGMRKLLEAKDCFVRANVANPVVPTPDSKPAGSES